MQIGGNIFRLTFYRNGVEKSKVLFVDIVQYKQHFLGNQTPTGQLPSSGYVAYENNDVVNYRKITRRVLKTSPNADFLWYHLTK